MIGVGSVVTKNWWMWMVPQVANPHLSSVSRCSTIQIVLNYISSGSIFRGDSLKESLELLNLMMLWWIYFGCIKKLIIESFGGSEEDLKGLFYWENYCNMGVRNAEHWEHSNILLLLLQLFQQCWKVSMVCPTYCFKHIFASQYLNETFLITFKLIQIFGRSYIFCSIYVCI